MKKLWESTKGSLPIPANYRIRFEQGNIPRYFFKCV